MTQQDNWRQEIARLAQRQNQLERQHRETTTRVDTLKRDADASKMDLDSRIDSLRREMDWQFRSREWRVKSLERFRDFIESLIMYVILIWCAVALVVSLVIIIVEVRGAHQESGQPEERSPSSMKAPWAATGEQVQPSLPPIGHISMAPVAQFAFTVDSSTGWMVPGPGQMDSIRYGPSSGPKTSPVATQPQSLRTNTMGRLNNSWCVVWIGSTVDWQLRAQEVWKSPFQPGWQG